MYTLQKNAGNELKLVVSDKSAPENTVESFSNINIMASWTCGTNKKQMTYTDKVTGKVTYLD